MSDDSPAYSTLQQVCSEATVILLAALGGFLVQILGGYSFPKMGCLPAYELKPILTAVRLPPVLAMIITGCVVRNFFGGLVVAYNEPWAQWIRYCCLGILLVRGGLQVTFKGKGLIILFMALVPMVFEAMT